MSCPIWFSRTLIAYTLSSWTFLTWIVVVGSSVVMLLWIVIYSFFQSNDFNDEVVILFGNVPFWASVVISIVVALGKPHSIGTFLFFVDLSTAPRFLIKFISTSYMPLDRDIVREMWVYGDLKDRLGIKHRKDRKNGDIEGAPMFHKPHARSHSEVSVVYESGRTSTTQLYLDSPPDTGRLTRAPPSQSDDTDGSQDSTTRPAYQRVEPWALRQRLPSDGASPTTTVGPSVATQTMPASSYEMQVRHQQEPTNASYRTADEDWDDEPRSRSRTPDGRYVPGQAL